MHAIPSVLHEFALPSSGQIGPASGSASGVLAAILAVGAAVIGTVTGAHADDCPIAYGRKGSAWVHAVVLIAPPQRDASWNGPVVHHSKAQTHLVEQL